MVDCVKNVNWKCQYMNVQKWENKNVQFTPFQW